MAFFAPTEETMNITLADALAALEGRKEFAVKRYAGLVVVNYLISLPDSFDGIRKEFRGITFDEATGEVVSRPFHKFYNINQKEETQYHAIKDRRATVYEKVDGSMIHVFSHPVSRKLMTSTRMSAETPQAQAAYRFLQDKPDLLSVVYDNIDRGYTPIFELVGPDNQIVVQYPARRLVYLHSRHRKTGEYWFDERFPDKANRYDIPFGEIFDHLGKEEFEGYVSQLDDGMWVKAKGEWYMARHRVVDDLMKPAYKLYEKALNNEIDDVFANAADRYKPVLQAIGDEVATDFAALRGRLLAAHDDLTAKTATRKDYVLAAKAGHQDLFSGLMAVYDKKEPLDFIRRRLMERYTVEKASKLFAEIDPEG